MQKQRLLKLAQHLETGKLIHKKFDYRVLNTLGIDKYGNTIDTFDTKGCGTLGCALGECPGVFKGWRFNNQRVPVYNTCDSATLSAKLFFGLSPNEVDYLFFPGEDSNPLPDSSTRKRVARHIRDFVKRRELK